jgi:hypothetical protein
MSKSQQVITRLQDGVTILSVDKKDIWDGTELCLIRDTLRYLIKFEAKTDLWGPPLVITNRRNMEIDLQFVQYLPSGFFGMICDVHTICSSVQLYCVHPPVQKMLWLRLFCEETEKGVFTLLGEPTKSLASANRSENIQSVVHAQESHERSTTAMESC